MVSGVSCTPSVFRLGCTCVTPLKPSMDFLRTEPFKEEAVSHGMAAKNLCNTSISYQLKLRFSFKRTECLDSLRSLRDSKRVLVPCVPVAFRQALGFTRRSFLQCYVTAFAGFPYQTFAVGWLCVICSFSQWPLLKHEEQWFCGLLPSFCFRPLRNSEIRLPPNGRLFLATFSDGWDRSLLGTSSLRLPQCSAAGRLRRKGLRLCGLKFDEAMS